MCNFLLLGLPQGMPGPLQPGVSAGYQGWGPRTFPPLLPYCWCSHCRKTICWSSNAGSSPCPGLGMGLGMGLGTLWGQFPAGSAKSNQWSAGEFPMATAWPEGSHEQSSIQRSRWVEWRKRSPLWLLILCARLGRKKYERGEKGDVASSELSKEF